MDKNAIKKYAVWARNELIARVTQKAEQYEITEQKTTPKDTDSINGRLLTDTEKNQRKALIEKIQADGFEQVMEEVAYTWFNRFTALRFMEVNNYLPSHTRVFTNEAGEFKPQILADAIQLELDGLDMDKVFELKDANKTEELYKYLLIVQCNALSDILPRMFQKIEHYTELLLPDYLLREGSVIEQMISLISEEDWTDQVQIIGWLYQFYNIEPKAKVFSKRGSVTKEELPAATQLFTPDWIVRYMVENSLGRLWLEGHPNDALKSEWEYYLDEADQEEAVQKRLGELRKEYAELKPEEIRCIDPCMGSGHILCYMFDVLVKIYENYGYTAREAASNIVEKNLWGLDIDERAAQLSYFAVMMKARQYDRRFFARDIQPHVYAIEESNGITSAPMHDMGIELSQEEYGEAVKQALRLVDEMHDAKEFGSIIHVTSCDWELLRRFAVPRGSGEGQMRMDIHGEIEASDRLQRLINIGEALSQKYHVVSTNPPYMGGTSTSPKLSERIKKEYPDSKSDLFAVFIERCRDMVKRLGYQAMITMHAWMFLSSYEKLRSKVNAGLDTINMIHLGARAFDEISGEVVQTTSFVFRNSSINNFKGSYVRLISPNSQAGKEEMFLRGENRFFTKKDAFEIIPGAPIAYWVSKEMLAAFNHKTLSNYGKAQKGLDTCDVGRFVRCWYEVDLNKICFTATTNNETYDHKWFPYSKGGEYRKWYGNQTDVVLWENNGEILRNWRDDSGKLKSRPQNTEDYFKPIITWSAIASSNPSMRYIVKSIYGGGGTAYIPSVDLMYCLAFLNSKVALAYLNAISPTLNFEAGHIMSLPLVVDKEMVGAIEKLAEENVKIAKEDWDAFETSWGFTSHPLLGHKGLIEDNFKIWEEECNRRFEKLKENEEAINRAFIDIYGLQREMTPDIDDTLVSVRRADALREIKSLISFAVGCMFGRYSLYKDGVQTEISFNSKSSEMFSPDRDAIIPVSDDEYFEDDILAQFIKFIEAAYGKETRDTNLAYIASVLGGKGSPREVIRKYFLNGFYTDHVKTYQKRPIYWMFDSGKKGGFRCLIYIHRYRPDMIARIRTDYVHEQQSRYRTAINDLSNRQNMVSGSEKIKLTKDLEVLKDQAEEIQVYEEKIHHLADQMISLDLDDGVKNNYDRLRTVLSKI